MQERFASVTGDILRFDVMPTLTEAVKRIMAGASARASVRRAGRIVPVDLLVAILEEESRGSELLVGAGLGRETAEQVWQQGFVAAAKDEDGLTLQIAPRESAELEAVIEAARRHASESGRHAELGSEHLVLGLAEVDSPARTLFQQCGITVERLREGTTLAEDTAPVSLPSGFTLEVDAPPMDRRRLIRALDAAANRASEGLRVAEDFARFVLDDRHLTQCLKQLRHRVQEGLAGIPRAERLAARDSRSDVGAKLVNPSAASRQTEGDLLAANLHRAEEALRSLEEFGRLLESKVGEHFESLRYELYTLDKALVKTQVSGDRLQGRNVYVLLTQSLCAAPVEEIIRGAATGGAGIFQVREKQMADRELLEYLRVVRRITRECDALFIVNDRPDLAVLCEADGVHVGQEELTVAEARRIVGSDCLIGVSTHSIEQARAAVLDGADYLGVGPVFPSQTKAFPDFAGLEFVAEVAGEIACPWYAIGGIDATNINRVRAAGAERVAVTGAICGAEDARVAAAGLREALGAVKE